MYHDYMVKPTYLSYPTSSQSQSPSVVFDMLCFKHMRLLEPSLPRGTISLEACNIQILAQVEQKS